MKNVLQNCLQILLEENERSRSVWDNEKLSVSPALYAQNICTIKLSLGRGSGHTTAIKNLARPTLDLVITQHPKDFHNLGLDVYEPYYMFDKLRGKRLGYERVFVDNASYIFEFVLGKAQFYEYISRYVPPKTYIFLG